MNVRHDPIEVPASAAAPWVEKLLWVFMAKEIGNCFYVQGSHYIIY